MNFSALEFFIDHKKGEIMQKQFSATVEIPNGNKKEFEDFLDECYPQLKYKLEDKSGIYTISQKVY